MVVQSCNDFLPAEICQGAFWIVFGNTLGCSDLFLLHTSHTQLRNFTSLLNVPTRPGCLACVDVLFLSHGSHVALTCLFAWLNFRVYPATADFRVESLQSGLG